MSRTHPPTLLTLTRRALADEIRVPRGGCILVAVSGGPDSMALVHVLARLRGATGHIVIAHGVDHGLRPEAAAELDVAEQFARGLHVPFERTVVRVAPGGNLQARARDARHEALQAAARRASAVAIATGHHADDRAETLLLRLVRGSGPRGLGVLPARARGVGGLDEARVDRVDLVRPFLRARRQDITAHLARHGVPFASDPSNLDRRYARARVRAELLPLLEEMNPGVVAHLCALSDRLIEAFGQAPGEDADSDTERDDYAFSPGKAAIAHTPPLPRATQLALAARAHFRKKGSSVEVSGGLVATSRQS